MMPRHVHSHNAERINNSRVNSFSFLKKKERERFYTNKNSMVLLSHRVFIFSFYILFFLLTQISVGNDGLTTEPFYLVMSLFFTVGKEVKREVKRGGERERGMVRV